MLQRLGNVSTEEMFRVFNMGIGFILAVPDDSRHLSTIARIVSASGYRSHVLGRVIDDPSRSILLEPYSLRGVSGAFRKV
jgi:phosphoribosylformylglycinamidine cyclo-ligase